MTYERPRRSVQGEIKHLRVVVTGTPVRASLVGYPHLSPVAVVVRLGRELNRAYFHCTFLRVAKN